MTKIKICGITNLEDARLALELGADELGFNFYAGSSRYITPQAAKDIVEKLPSSTLTVGVFVNMSMNGIIEVSQIAGLTTIQLHGDENGDFVRTIRRQAGLKIIKVIRIGPIASFIHDPFLDAHAILLDAFSPNERGGTGRTFNWTVARELTEAFSTIYLAGGLNAENVADAIRTVKPYAVDVASGVESSPGRKDPEKIAAFIKAAKEAI